MTSPAGKSKIPIFSASTKTPAKCFKLDINCKSSNNKLHTQNSLNTPSKNGNSSSIPNAVKTIRFTPAKTTKCPVQENGDLTNVNKNMEEALPKNDSNDEKSCDSCILPDYGTHIIDENNNLQAIKEKSQETNNYRIRGLERSQTFCTSKESCCLTGEAKSKMKKQQQAIVC